ncbi:MULTISPECIES: hypothetical protein [unclassified Pseudoalteromonas]|uniref:hypothetical protein n=1 Tax=unclassified Pseudoalteromonas TaxID=194690 RepID=UPI0025B4E5C7|nr:MULTISPECIES: hypothetical protein [unclassified Pseudoalteromonas]MDN3377679.1 hypothetical protein [Pseudoalteromonas sp. APC 3893]MDN3385875.1 hypothetical protein [Pseudoalteromonas sp. APC 4017]
MFWRKKKQYMFPHDYTSFTEGLFVVCELKHSISFIEVCNHNGVQHCINRKATMKQLLANHDGNLYFRGFCEELKDIRVFELLMPEYEIDGQLQVISQWFFSVTGETKYSFTQRCYRQSPKLMWQGECEVTFFIDVCTIIENGQLKEACIKRKFDALKLYTDSKDDFFVEFTDLNINKVIRTYPLPLKFTTGESSYLFEEWCKNILGFKLWNFFPPEH